MYADSKVQFTKCLNCIYWVQLTIAVTFMKIYLLQSESYLYMYMFDFFQRTTNTPFELIGYIITYRCFLHLINFEDCQLFKLFLKYEIIFSSIRYSQFVFSVIYFLWPDFLSCWFINLKIELLNRGVYNHWCQTVD